MEWKSVLNKVTAPSLSDQVVNKLYIFLFKLNMETHLVIFAQKPTKVLILSCVECVCVYVKHTVSFSNRFQVTHASPLHLWKNLSHKGWFVDVQSKGPISEYLAVM